MTKLTPGEMRFWQAAAAQKDASSIHLLESQAPEAWRDSPSDHRTHIYALDSSTGRVVSATMETADLAALAEQMSKQHGFASGPVALRCAALSIIGCQDSPQARQELMGIVTAACTCSMLFQQVRRTTDLEGHWILYAYKLANGDALARVAFAPVDPASHMSDNQVSSEVRRMVAADMAAKGHPLYQHIQAGGGAVLTPGLVSPLAGETSSQDAPQLREQNAAAPTSSASSRPRPH